MIICNNEQYDLVKHMCSLNEEDKDDIQAQVIVYEDSREQSGD